MPELLNIRQINAGEVRDLWEPVMPRSRRRLTLIFCLAVIGTIGEQSSASDPADYTSQVKPILQARCYTCHGALARKAGLRVDTGAAIREGGDGGPAVDLGSSADSLLIDRVTATEPDYRMPPEGSPLGSEEVAILRAWINQGALSPPNERPEADPRQHWAFVPPSRPVVPAVSDQSEVFDPIDAFLSADRASRGLSAMPPAPAHVLLRRLYLDLIGLPPTREQLKEFLDDPSEREYERVVNRLLADPRYGERWARHWMDVWRYSDWYGRRAVPDVLNSYAMIWRWRDWIVRSLNEDKGYDRMVREMIAADEIAPTDEANLVATGYLVRNFYRWNYNSWMKDNVEHTGKAFLGLTFNCAHCHDHKYDPIRHEDYFAFRAVFEPLELRHDRVPGEPDPGPYPKYDYGKAYGPITSGMVRVFDEKLDAKTYLYTRGESRNVVPDRPPIPPGMPRFLGGESFRVEPIELPAEVSYPGLKGFVRREEIARREAAMQAVLRQLDLAREQAKAASLVLADAEAGFTPSVLRAFPDPLDGTPAFASQMRPSRDLEAARQAAEAARRDLAVAEAEEVYGRAESVAIHARIAADEARISRNSPEADVKAREAAGAERRSRVAQTKALLLRAERAVFQAREKTPEELAKAIAARDAAEQTYIAARDELKTDFAEYTPLSPTYPSRSTGRRAALARWITDHDNPLTARVAVNHLWRWHFGTPLVATTYDFGRNGSLPTHPVLLDWLAVELMEPSTPGVAPWSMKAIHRRIVMSAAYRMSSHTSDTASIEANRAIDPENQAYWRFPVARLEAEEVRDALLHVAGGLDATLGGPDIDFAQGLTSRRRSLYFTHHGEGRMPFLELFDAPDACDAYRRTSSVVPQQALALVNNSMLISLSRGLADRLWSQAAEPDESARVDEFLTAAFEQVLARPPSQRELVLSVEFLANQQRLLERNAGADGKLTTDEPAALARRDLIHALFSHHNFITVH